MKQATANAKYIRISPKKARVVADLIRGLSIDAAMFQLSESGTKAGRLLAKTLSSAAANAELQHEGFNSSEWKLMEVRVDKGPNWKRAKSKSRGGRAPVLKRTSHFTLVVGTE